MWVGTETRSQGEGGGQDMRQILSAATFTQIPNHKTSKKEKKT